MAIVPQSRSGYSRLLHKPHHCVGQEVRLDPRGFQLPWIAAPTRARTMHVKYRFRHRPTISACRERPSTWQFKSACPYSVPSIRLSILWNLSEAAPLLSTPTQANPYPWASALIRFDGDAVARGLFTRIRPHQPIHAARPNSTVTLSA